MAGRGLPEMATRSVQRTAKEAKDCGIVRVVEILGADPAWQRETVTTESLRPGEPLSSALNPQPIIDWPVTEGDGARTCFTVLKPSLQRLIDGRTRGIAFRALGAMRAAFYSTENQSGARSARLPVNGEGPTRSDSSLPAST